MERFAGKAYNNLIKSDNITLTSGFYTHVLPTLHSETLDFQLNLGKKALDSISSRVGMVPEFDASGSHIDTYNKAGWEYVLVQNSINKLYDYRDDLSKGELNIDDTTTFCVIQNYLDSELRAIVTEGPRLRDSYLKILRGLDHPEHFIDILIEQAEHKQENYVPFLIDLEAIQINKGLDYFNDFINCLSDANGKGIDFIGFDDSTLKEFDKQFQKDVPKVKMATRSKSKWILGMDDIGIIDQLKDIDIEELSNYHKLVYSWATVSDYYSALIGLSKPNGYITKLPTLSGKEITIKSDSKRPQEIIHAIKTLKNGKTLVESSDIQLHDYSKKRLSKLHELFEDL